MGFVLRQGLFERLDELLLETKQYDLFKIQFTVLYLPNQIRDYFRSALYLNEDFLALRNGCEHLSDGGNFRSLVLFVFP